MKNFFAAVLTAFLLVAAPVAAQTVNNGGSGLRVGAPISGSCANGLVLFSNSGFLGCEAVAGTGTVTSITLATPNSTLALSGTNPVTTSGTVNVDIDLTHANIWSGQQTFVAPVLGTIASGVGTNLTGIPTTALTGTTTDPTCATWDSTTAVTAQTIDFPVAWATYTITSVKAKVGGGGSFTYAVKIGGAGVTSCNVVTVNSSSNVNTSCTAANTGAANDIVSIVIASPSGTVNQAYVCPVFTHTVN